jgi:exopolyphosphatase/guanosine-5'-triphosphate,3'-diphosphate pyrophosphatase
MHPVGDPPSVDDWQACREAMVRVLEREVAPAVRPMLQSCPDAIAVGASGTATILARMFIRKDTYERELLDGIEISLPVLRGIREQLWKLPIEQRRAVPGVPPERADVLLVGVAAYELVLDLLGFASVRVSMRGLRFAALMDELTR